MATNGIQTNGNDVAATSLLASFVADANVSWLTTEVRDKVKEAVTDYIGVTIGALVNAPSTSAIYNAILTLQGGKFHGDSACTVLGKGEPHFLPQYAALLNAALSHSLDFDDTYIDGTLHAGCTAVSAAFTQAELQKAHVSGEELMLAVAVGYEVTCRIGRELGFEAYHRGFHNTSTAGIFGAVASIAVLKKLSAEVVAMAFGLAGSNAAGSMQYLDNGSWNKRLHPGFAVNAAFTCVSLAGAGVIGATRSIEGKNGFLKAYSPNENVDLHRLVRGLGQEWAWLSNAPKPYPACRMTHALIELAGSISTTFPKKHGGRPLVPTDIQKITLSIPASNFILVGDPTPNKIHPNNIVDGQFSLYFQVANALIYGSNTGLEAYKKLQDPAIRDLCSKTTVLPDEKVRGFPGRISIVWADGTEEEQYQEFALGEIEHPFTKDRVEAKFFSLAAPAYGQAKAEQILKTVDALESANLASFFKLLQ